MERKRADKSPRRRPESPPSGNGRPASVGLLRVLVAWKRVGGGRGRLLPADIVRMRHISRLSGAIPPGTCLERLRARWRGHHQARKRAHPHAFSAAMSGLTPMMFITRVKL